MPIETIDIDIAVVGGSSSGVAAAIAARRTAERWGVTPSVALMYGEPRSVGGMLTNGVCSVDVLRLAAAPNGLFREFADRVAARYVDNESASEGLNSERFADGLVYEPAVAFEVVREMIAETDRIYEFAHTRVTAAHTRAGRISAIDLESEAGDPVRVRARVFIDATVEGDLLAMVGAEGTHWVSGRESRLELAGRHDVHPLTAVAGETYAGKVVVDPRSQAVIAGDGSGDDRSQSFNYRLTLELDGWAPDEWAHSPPAGYARHLAYYRRHTAPPMARGRPCEHLGIPGGHWVQQCLPNGKVDLNFDPINLNHGYVHASSSDRRFMAGAVLEFGLGFLHFLRTERGLGRLGLSRNDYPDDPPVPATMYVREGRRMRGEYLFTEWDARASAPDVRPQPAPRLDFVASGEYSMDSHCVTGFRDDLVAEHGLRLCEGGYWLPMTKPYQIPFGVLIPSGIDGLMVSTAVSASHVGYSTLRMEPVRMALGQAAGTAAVHAVRSRVQPRDVRIDRVQYDLAVSGQALRFWDSLPSHSGLHPTGRTTSWAFPYLQFLGGRGALEDIGDGYSIDPGEELTRGRLARLVVDTVAREVEVPSTPFFADIDEGSEHYGAVQVMHAKGWLPWWGDDFAPAEMLRRAELAKVMKFVADIPYVSRADASSFADVEPDYWAFPYIEALVRAKLIYPTGDDPLFRPFDTATLAEAAQMLTLAIVRSR